jgi:hypothetical protein
MTSNGLQVEQQWNRAIEAAPDKVHLSSLFLERPGEVDRVMRQVHALAGAGIPSGINLLVGRDGLVVAGEVVRHLRDGGIENDRISYLPMRGQNTPSRKQMGEVAGSARLQSMTCLAGYAVSLRFCSIGWNEQVAWCAYTTARRTMEAPTLAGMMGALDGLELVLCGGTD